MRFIFALIRLGVVSLVCMFWIVVGAIAAMIMDWIGRLGDD